MESLPKDVLSEMVLNLTPPDLIKFCSTGKLQNKIVCESETFWRRKLERDYPEEFLEFYETGIPVKKPKAVYVKRFTFISRKIEDFVEFFIYEVFNVGFKKFLTEEYRQELFNAIYSIYEASKKYKGQELNDLIQEYMSNLYPNTIDLALFDPIIEVEKFMDFLQRMEFSNEQKRKQAIEYKKRKNQK